MVKKHIALPDAQKTANWKRAEKCLPVENSMLTKPTEEQKG